MSSPRASALALAALAVICASASAQTGRTIQVGSSYRPQIIPFTPNPNMYIAPNLTAQQLGYNVSVLAAAARQVPPYLYGYNPYPPTIINTAPLVPQIAQPIVPINPYSISTVPTVSPYAPTGSLSTSPYSLSTVPGAGYPGASTYTPYYNPYGYIQDPYSSTIQGLASLTAATGQYYKDIQTARISREQSRQMSLDTTKKKMELAMWYETVRPDALKSAARERAGALEMARKYASSTDITSGKALNTLLDNLPVTGLNKGDSISLADDVANHLNLSGGTSAGNIGLLKSLADGGKLRWPQALEEKGYNEARNRLDGNLKTAVSNLKDKDDITAATMRSIRADYKDIADKLSESADNLDAGQYIEAKRFLNQLNTAIRGLSDPKAKNYFGAWTAKGHKTVAELVAHMKKEGLTFAPAAPGDEASYGAMYQALRAFDSSLQASKQ